MNNSAQDIATVNSYGALRVTLQSQGKEIVVMSDLHIASGLNANLNYDGTENFFADAAFARFIQSLQNNLKDNKSILVINGDFIDFLRIKEYPETKDDFIQWQKMLQAIGIAKTLDELTDSISTKEKEYGLKTNDYKSVWKLHKCVYGHKILFEQLAAWLANGNTLIIVKGNHDLEWYWDAVRKSLGYLFSMLHINPTAEELLSIKQNLHFVDNSLVIDNKIYVEHGHIYENTTEVKGEPTINNTELNLPFGSFFNRYLINRLELAYPFLDNIRPQQKILPLLLRERFPLALKVLFHYVPFMLLVIPKKLFRQVFKYLFDIVVVIILPLVITGYAIYKNVDFSKLSSANFFGQQLLTIAKNFGLLFLSYIFGRFIAMARLGSLPTFTPVAEKIFNENTSLQIVTFGHSHNPEQHSYGGDKHYFNTGTWMPVYDLSMADVRLEKTFTYLLIQQDANGEIISNQLLRWNDDAMRADAMILRDRK